MIWDRRLGSLLCLLTLPGCIPSLEGTRSFALLTADASWRAPEVTSSQAVSIADWNGDGFPDLAFAGAIDDEDIAPLPNLLYESVGDGSYVLVWESPEVELSFGLAWADMDGDGDPDLAVANEEAPDRVYENVGGDLVALWAADTDEASFDVAWGDVDGDGDPDLATASIDGGNQIYKNVDGILDTEPWWTAPHGEETASIAWTDVDGDGDLDLACANEDGPNRLYMNEDGSMESAWLSDEDETTLGLAVGDLDADGWPDLAVVNEFSGVSVYRNEEGVLSTSVSWAQTTDADINSDDVAWGDINGDGLEDLIVVGQERDRIWINEGDLSFVTEWTSENEEASSGVDVADLDADGDLEIVVAIGNRADAVFDNPTGGGWADRDDDDQAPIEEGCNCSHEDAGRPSPLLALTFVLISGARRRRRGQPASASQ